MNKILFTIFFSCALFTGTNVQVIAQHFKAGAAMVDITPPLGTTMNGGFYTAYARKIHDPLHAKAIVLQKNSVTIALVVVDICYMENPFIKETKKLIEKETGIKPENVLISATHAHSAGAVESWCLAFADLPYRSKLPSLITESIKKAKKNTRPAKIAFGYADVPEHVVCRRYFMKNGYVALNPVSGDTDIVKTNPGGATPDQIDRPVSAVDPELSYMAIKGVDGRWISVLGNYSMHYVGDFESSTVTADYFGEFSRQVKQKINAGEDFVGILSNGTSGDANIIDYLQPDRYPKENYAKTKLIANDLSDRLIKSLDKITWESNPSLEIKSVHLPVATRKPNPDEVKKASKVIAETDYANFPGNFSDAEQMHRLYMLSQLVLNDFPDSVLLAIQAMKIGNNIIGALGGEIFSETGLYLKKNSPKDSYFTISNANGYVGYIPTPKDFELGGYETWRCTSSCLEPNAEVIIREKLLDMIKKLK